MIRNICVALLIAGSVGSTVAGASQLDYRIGAALGHDSNPLRVAGDGVNAVYTQLRADAFYQAALGRKAKFFAEGDGSWRFFESAGSDADYGYGELSAGVALRPQRFGSDRLAIFAGATTSVRRSTYTDRVDGEVYTVPTLADPLATVAIPDRFDSNTLGAFVNMRYRVTDRVRAFLESRRDQVHFTEDYAGLADLDSIDYRSLSVEPGVSLRITETLSASVSLSWTDVDYAQRPALDSTGSEVNGSQREYRYLGYQLRLAIKPTDRWNLRFGFTEDFRDDTFAGYYDSASDATYLSVRRAVGDKGHLRFYTSFSTLDYDRATVFGDVNGETRGSDERRFITTYDRRLNERLRWFVEGGVQRTDNNDPVFAHDRDWFLTGINFRR